MATANPSADDLKLFSLQQKYQEEASKRLRSDGVSQFIELEKAGSTRLNALAEDPWADHAALNNKEPIKNGATYKFVILGAGYAGLVIAARLVEAGIAGGPDDIRIIDTAGGFGGTWYWNRYPGLQCDIESYSYMPLLEETGYMPKKRYASGLELREHAERIAQKFELDDKALFRARVTGARWVEETNLWKVEIAEGRGPGEETRNLSVQANYFLVASGILTTPHVPKIPGLEDFTGPIFHTARWDYSTTGGKQSDPSMSGLKGKRVGILGTGATAIQVVPELAKWAEELYVFQRTPSGVNWRGQRETDPEEWKTKIAYKKGWQRERQLNLDSFLTYAPKEVNMVGDAWTEMEAYCAIIGSPTWGIIEPTPEKIGEHVGRLYKLDIKHSEGRRARVDSIVEDTETANKLKAWYPTWCKRPTFSDEYLQTFNLPHVHLMDTNGKGVQSSTPKGLIVDGKEYPIDILVLSTGYRSPAYGGGNPVVRTGIDLRGRENKSFNEKWEAQGATTLHGVCTNSFPNLFFAPMAQFGSAANNACTIDVAAEHIAHIIGQAEKKAGGTAVVEATVEAEEAYAGEILRRAAFLAAVMGCTPGYITSEGEFTAAGQDPMVMMKKSRMSGWAQGMEHFIGMLQEYRADGSLKGIEVKKAVSSS
ncbi:Pentalenolactone D synthase [Podospora australis]|uniref:Pentalenolactone D synthase n=1 Tax=Podospora australis TaxID=1536484 RepID=A0AAN7AG58_9PEZI|nr:Pentalenolactone D synthase [Podospora australis]